jgi:tRNA uridine 5-carboxymethylaminomethyl modification enzyme
MFTSRAEFRLTLRADNADQRLTTRGVELGLVGHARATAYAAKSDTLQRAISLAKTLALTSAQAAKAGFKVNQDGLKRTALDLIGMPEVGFSRVAEQWPELKSLPRHAVEALEAESLYAGYMQRQDAEIATLRREEHVVIPSDMDYMSISSLSMELRLKLTRVKPATLAQAARMEGMTPAGLAVVLSEVRMMQKGRAA